MLLMVALQDEHLRERLVPDFEPTSL